jgi:hypothetical protein
MDGMKVAVRLGFAGAVLGVALGAAEAASAACRPPARHVSRVVGVARTALDGATLCIQTGADPVHLTRLRLLDVKAPRLGGPGGEGAKWALRRVARGRAVSCTTTGGGIGVCRIDRVRIGDLLAARGR